MYFNKFQRCSQVQTKIKEKRKKKKKKGGQPPPFWAWGGLATPNPAIWGWGSHSLWPLGGDRATPNWALGGGQLATANGPWRWHTTPNLAK